MTDASPAASKPWYMKWWVWLIAAVLVIGAIGNALGGGDDDSTASPSATETAAVVATEEPTEEAETPSPEPTEPAEPAAPARHEVPWGDYSPTVQTGIDDLTAAGDCAGLQEQFDIADANNEATMTRTGHNNADLMAYIGESLELAGCS